MQFEWDKEKAARNLKKHGVGFEEAETVFGDLSAKMFFDDEHSDKEEREFISVIRKRIDFWLFILPNAKIKK